MVRGAMTDRRRSSQTRTIRSKMPVALTANIGDAIRCVAARPLSNLNPQRRAKGGTMQANETSSAAESAGTRETLGGKLQRWSYRALSIATVVVVGVVTLAQIVERVTLP